MPLNLKNKSLKAFVTVGGLGYSPKAPGTVGSIPALFLFWFFPQWGAVILIILLTISLMVCAAAESIFVQKDPSCFVMDEVCGMMVTLLNCPHDIRFFIAGFAIFRLLDIFKPWPIILFQRIKHPQAIVWDDIAAGVGAYFILTGIGYLFN